MKDAKSKRSNLRYLSYFIYFVCGMLIIYSVVPWQAAGTAIGTAIVTLPLIKQLQTVPLGANGEFGQNRTLSLKVFSCMTYRIL